MIGNALNGYGIGKVAVNVGDGILDDFGKDVIGCWAELARSRMMERLDLSHTSQPKTFSLIACMEESTHCSNCLICSWFKRAGEGEGAEKQASRSVWPVERPVIKFSLICTGSLSYGELSWTKYP